MHPIFEACLGYLFNTNKYKFDSCQNREGGTYLEHCILGWISCSSTINRVKPLVNNVPLSGIWPITWSSSPNFSFMTTIVFNLWLLSASHDLPGARWIAQGTWNLFLNVESFANDVLIETWNPWTFNRTRLLIFHAGLNLTQIQWKNYTYVNLLFQIQNIWLPTNTFIVQDFVKKWISA